MSRYLRWISYCLTGLLLGAAYLLNSIWLGEILLIIPIVLLAISLHIRWRWVPSLAFILIMVLAAVGALLSLNPLLLLSGVVAGLFSWDLTRFHRRVQGFEPGTSLTILENRHLGRLLWVGILGFGLPVVALQIKIQLSFGLIVFFALLLAIILGQVTRLISKTVKQSS